MIIIIIALFLGMANIVLYCIFYKPERPNKDVPYDFILLLGCPSQSDGTLSIYQKKRIQAAITYIQEGYSTTVVISGGSVHNQYTEAEVMKQALLKACPKITIYTETKARNTYQNLKNVKGMMNGKSILVVSGSSHLRRAYFFVRKFYTNAHMGCASQRDPWLSYLYEYTRMWVAFYWEIKLSLQRKRH